jgi:hypothetical protein
MTACEVYFPEASEVAQHGAAFVQMMFAHVHFESEVGALQDAVTKKPAFSELGRNQWHTKERPKEMVKLIKKHRGDIPQTEAIAKLLCEAIDPCEQRNLLTHGVWWHFDPRTSSITVRRGRSSRLRNTSRAPRLYRSRHQGAGGPIREYPVRAIQNSADRLNRHRPRVKYVLRSELRKIRPEHLFRTINVESRAPPAIRRECDARSACRQ